MEAVRKAFNLLAVALTVSACVAVDKSSAGYERVRLEVYSYRIEPEGLRVFIRISNFSENDICLFDPPEISISADLVDSVNGYTVSDGYVGDAFYGSGNAGGADLRKRRTMIIKPNATLKVETVEGNLARPILQDKSGVSVSSKIHRDAIVVSAKAIVIDCEAGDADSAIQQRRFETLESAHVKLSGNLDQLIPN